MAQSTILASANTAGTSTDVTVAAGSNATIGIFVASGTQFDGDERAVVYADTPAGDNPIGELNQSNKTMVITGPGTFRVIRDQCGTACGIYLEQ